MFYTTGRGKVLNKIFEDDNRIGLIGIAGAKIKTKMPSAWWDCPKKYRVINIIQQTIDNKINNRPRKRYGYHSCLEKMEKLLFN